MNNDRWTKIETLVEQALELAPVERDTFIENQCGEDEALRNEIQSLLEHGDKALSFMGHFEKKVVAPSIDVMARDQFNEDHRINTQFGHYHITDILGRGGMGIVYKAGDTNLDRTVALKFLPSHLTRSKKDKQRFIREAKAAAALNHSNICTIYSVEEYEDQHFISMEYIDGQTLRQKLEAEEITPKIALTYASQIAEALAEAHEKGIVHRDIKPGNIMVDAKGRIKVMDFGLAKTVNSQPITQTGTTLGTMAYMSPEQIQGRPVDHRADLFSFGVLLFEMLTGQRPFGGQHETALSYAIVNEDPQHLSDFLPNALQKLSMLINRLLEKDPAKRYSDSEKLAGELKTCLDALPEDVATSKVTHTTIPDQKKIGSNRSSSITLNLPSQARIITLAVLLIAVIGVGYWLLPEATITEPVNNKIAVLPLESISTEPEDIQFTDGVHEELINRLAGISDLTVVARRSVLGFPPHERQDLQLIAEQLGVSTLMDGTVRRMGDQLRVSVHLIDANNLTTIWSGSFDENIDNVFEIQSRIARQVAGELQASLTAEEHQLLSERPTDNPEAYRLYMLGREYLSRISLDIDYAATSIDFFQRALELDPEFAQAWGLLGNAYHFIYWFRGQEPEDLQKLENAAEQALVYGPDFPETYLAYGVNLYWKNNNNQTLTYFESAIQNFPNDPYLQLMTAFTHRRLGNWEDSIEHFEQAIELDPLNDIFYVFAAFTSWMMRDYKNAIAFMERKFEMNPDWYHFIYCWIIVSRDGSLDGYEKWFEHIRPSDPSTQLPSLWAEYNLLKRDWDEALQGFQHVENEVMDSFEMMYITRTENIAETLDYSGEKEQARFQFENLIDHLLEKINNENEKNRNSIRYRVSLANAYARIGKLEEAQAEVEQVTKLGKIYRDDAVNWPRFETQMAVIYAWAGQEELAIDKLEYLLSVPSRIHRNHLRLDPKWDPLRDNPRFQELIAGEDKPYIEGL